MLLLMLLVTAGCTTKIAYNYAHWWANWAVDDYIDLDREQKAFFKSEFRQLHQWHRETQLPLYVEFLEQLRTTLSEQQLTADSIHKQALATQQLMEHSKKKVTPALAQLLSSLSAKQADKLLKTLARETEKYLEENTYKTEEKRHKARRKAMTRFIKKWIGPLSREQKQLIEEWAQAMHPMAQLDADQQMLWQQKFADALAGAQQADIQIFLDRYLLDDESLWQAEYREQTEKNRRATRQLLANLLNSRSDKQRRKLDKKLNNLIEDFTQLQ
ncbi:DUF6279 family lipoprotein [Porticoccus sp. W117]|uniref:DUF6279 family lipoprotein n=1 Tax=Porticoccus sp. W117 TaxID=3054777 RepID=UPI002592594E|nr:DUF6279 family lipoprotein [Porticoccus sp. W117]MDM3869991.1 DUF6279 family lipoprotein [Porticoccus sp. W117]